MLTHQRTGWLSPVKKRGYQPNNTFPAVFSSIPPELLFYILSYLDKNSLIDFACVCIAFHQLHIPQQPLYERAPFLQLFDYKEPPFLKNLTEKGDVYVLSNGDVIIIGDFGERITHHAFWYQSRELKLEGWSLFGHRQALLLKNNYLAVVVKDGIAIWDRRSGSQRQFLKHSDPRSGKRVFWHGNDLYVVSKIGFVDIWRYNEKHVYLPFSNHKKSYQLTDQGKDFESTSIWLKKIEGVCGYFLHLEKRYLDIFDFVKGERVSGWSHEALLALVQAKDPLWIIEHLEINWKAETPKDFLMLSASNGIFAARHYLFNVKDNSIIFLHEGPFLNVKMLKNDEYIVVKNLNQTLPTVTIHNIGKHAPQTFSCNDYPLARCPSLDTPISEEGNILWSCHDIEAKTYHLCCFLRDTQTFHFLSLDFTDNAYSICWLPGNKLLLGSVFHAKPMSIIDARTGEIEGRWQPHLLDTHELKKMELLANNNLLAHWRKSWMLRALKPLTQIYRFRLWPKQEPKDVPIRPEPSLVQSPTRTYR